MRELARTSILMVQALQRRSAKHERLEAGEKNNSVSIELNRVETWADGWTVVCCDCVGSTRCYDRCVQFQKPFRRIITERQRRLGSFYNKDAEIQQRQVTTPSQAFTQILKSESAKGKPDAPRRTDANFSAHADRNSHFLADANAECNSQPHADTNADRNSNSYVLTDRDSDPNSYADSNRNGYRVAKPERDAHRNLPNHVADPGIRTGGNHKNCFDSDS